jgi:hypothetical protein
MVHPISNLIPFYFIPVTCQSIEKLTATPQDRSMQQVEDQVSHNNHLPKARTISWYLVKFQYIEKLEYQLTLNKLGMIILNAWRNLSAGSHLHIVQ